MSDDKFSICKSQIAKESDDKKPRELLALIYKKTNDIIRVGYLKDAEPAFNIVLDPNTDEKVKFVEHSAYQQKCDEVERLKKVTSTSLTIFDDLKNKIQEQKKEIARLNGECDHWQKICEDMK